MISKIIGNQEKPVSGSDGYENTEISAIVNELGAKNLWDIEGWLNKIGVSFTKSGNAYSLNIANEATYSNPYVFSDHDITITVSAENIATNIGAYDIKILDSSDIEIGHITSATSKTVTCLGCKLKIAVSSTGTLTLTAPMIRDARIADDTYVPCAMTNRELTERTSITEGYFALDSSLFEKYKKVYYSKMGKLVSLYFNCKASADIASDVQIGTTPDDLKPSVNCVFSANAVGGGLYIDNTGIIRIYKPLNTNAWIYSSVTYMTK